MTQIDIDPELLAELRSAAAAKALTPSELAQQVIEDYARQARAARRARETAETAESGFRENVELAIRQADDPLVPRISAAIALDQWRLRRHFIEREAGRAAE